VQRCLTCCSRGAITLLIFLLTAGAAWAQATARLSGTVRDNSGAVLPGVTITATQTDTGAVRTTVSDETGGYVLTNLPLGPYRLEVALQGFRTYVQTGIVLQVDAAPTVNPVLEVGSLEESVTVEAAAPLVDVRSAGISAVVNNAEILELPLQGRQVTDLIVLAGAAVNTGAPTRGMPGGVRISVAGGLPFGVAYTLDEAEHNNPQSNANLPLPFPDALQEFRVASSGLSAENGVKSGASVNAVTKSGTNRFTGSGFEFLRDRRFNAPQHFAALGPDGKQVDDGLRRNQFGGTLGGPIIRDKLFFFGAYQGTIRRQLPADHISYVPTAQMLAGDFTTITSPQCAGRQINLGAPFVGNRIDPAQFSRAALNIAAKLPQSTDPCGLVNWDAAENEDQHMPITRIDYQMTSSQLIFGRYMGTKQTIPAPWTGPGDNILKTSTAGTNDQLHALVLGQTHVMSSSVVNAVRFTYNSTNSRRGQNPGFFSPADVGVKMYSYPPGDQFPLTVSDNFDINSGGATLRRSTHQTYAMSDDLTLVKGSHQLGFGANVRRWKFDTVSTSRTGGTWTVDGSLTGHSLADFLTGRVARLEIGGPSILDIHNWYLGAYAQDAWRMTDRVTINAGVRWEPYFGQFVENDAIVIWRQENFEQNIRSKVFLNAPPGLVYPGDEGFPEGKTGLNTQWWNLAPRLGVAWDVRGDGRLAVRSSYSMGYDFMAGEYHNINAGAPPFGNRSLINNPPGGMDDPWAHLGGDPHPIITGPNVEYLPYGAFGSMDPDINSPRAQQWNLTVEQQLGDSWGVSASYLGSYADRLWAQTALNPGVFKGLGPCTLNTPTGPRTYSVCSTTGNVNDRRKLSLEDPIKAAGIGALDLNSDVGWQKYHGLKLEARLRAANGVSLHGSYTLSRCKGTPTTNDFNQTSAGYSDPENPDLDAGYCDQDRRHLGGLNLAYQTPDVGAGVVHAIASNWRLSGILSARSGARLNITSGVDRAFTGAHNSVQRPDQISDDIYGSGKSASPKPGEQIDNYFNRDAFRQAAPGTLGNASRNVAVGPKFWQVDLAISKLVSVVGTQRLELRFETFNLFDTFNWGDPATNFNAATFGRITTQAGIPRILQFGIKYDF
jgi:carboxypeptidase family protein/TonB-dependent receptor-like protein